MNPLLFQRGCDKGVLNHSPCLLSFGGMRRLERIVMDDSVTVVCWVAILRELDWIEC